MTDPESGVALLAMADGESFNDTNKNGFYDEGETIIGREDPMTPSIPENANVSSGEYSSVGGEAAYMGRMEGSGNIIFGDTINGPVGTVEAFLFAENNFTDITSDKTDQNPYIFGNMTAGNRVYLNRNKDGWDGAGIFDEGTFPVGSGNPETDWVLIDGYYYPPGTDSSNYDNPFVTYRRAKYVEAELGGWSVWGSESKKSKPSNYTKASDGYYYLNGDMNTGTRYRRKSSYSSTYYRSQRTWVEPMPGYYQIYASKHTPLLLGYDNRIETGVISLPGLPHSVEVTQGSWQILVWRQHEGRNPNLHTGN
jgi:hypothetical protein